MKAVSLSWPLIALVCILTCWFCGCGGQVPPSGDDADGSEDTQEPDSGHVPDPEVYVTAPDADMMIDQVLSDGLTITYPLNQMLLLMNEGTSRSVVEGLVAQIGGTIVGQVPDIDFYQIELSTSTQIDLDAAIDQAESNANVSSAGYNVVPATSQSCPAESDNRDILQEDQCAFAETEYFQALTMFEFFRPHLTLNPVTVGIVDTGLDPSTGEFSSVDMMYLNNIAELPTDLDSDLHGTGVCGVVAADDNGNGVNGIASRFLGNNLSIVVGSMNDAASSLTYAMMACSAGASVVNLSLGTGDWTPRVTVIRDSWVRLIGRRLDTLFVAASGNEGIELTGLNYSPGGIDLPNVITVAATARCSPQELASFSNYGSLIDIAAPGDGFPVVTSGGMYVPASGTSYSAPMVTSLAAILESIHPGLTPAQVKNYITSYALPLAEGIDVGRLTFTNSISQLLIDMSVGDPIESWLDPLGLGTFGASGLVLGRLCPNGITYSVTDYGSHDIYEPDEDVGIGLIGSPDVPPVVSVSGSDGTSSFRLGSTTMSTFVLGTYPIVAESSGDTLVASFTDYDSWDLGLAVSGTATFDTCRIDERDPFTGVDPWIVTVSGDFSGVMEVSHSDGRDPSYHEFDGYFTMPMLVSSDDDDLMNYLEVTCEGGIPQEAETDASPGVSE